MFPNVPEQPVWPQKGASAWQNPFVLRGGGWVSPLALEQGNWFAMLADSFNDDSPIDIAMSNEEASGPTQKIHLPLAEYIANLNGADNNDNPPLSGVAQAAQGYAKALESTRFPALQHVHRRINAAFGQGVSHSYFWVGPRGARTGMHWDDEDNVLITLAGQKRVRLFPLHGRAGLYPNDKYDSGTETCDVNTDNPDQYPLLDGVHHLGRETILGAGDLLYIPKFHYHEVVTLETSVAVNFFTSTRSEDWTRGFMRRGLHRLHCWGLYRNSKCTCHM